MSLKIAVCDDQFSALTQFDVYLNQIQQEIGEHFDIFYFSSGEDLLEGMPRDVNVLLLDIQMNNVSGLDAARKLRAEGAEFFLFFVTSNVQYALEGYEVHAYAFLCKPLQYMQLKKYLLEVREKLHHSHEATLQLQSNGGIQLYSCSEILYVEVYGHAITVVTNMDRKTFQRPLSEVESILCQHSFFRCHKSFLINLQHVKSLHALDITMSNGEIVPLSKRRKGEFLSVLQEEMGGY